MLENLFLTADDVARIMKISKSHAYKIVRALNEELNSKGYITISGRLNKNFFFDKVCYQPEYGNSRKQQTKEVKL